MWVPGHTFDGGIRAYSAAFTPPPYSDPLRGAEVRQRLLDVHSKRRGFRGLVARDDGTGEIVGMTYGYHGAPGQWWHDVVAQELGGDSAATWLGDSYELVEIAVQPSHQGQGIGAALIAALLRDRDEATCVLSTRTDSRAYLLYGRLGFKIIHEMEFARNGAPFYIMARRLPYETVTTPPATAESAAG
jgi:ribosomal protein S18 acetylase RimI-like enzyme